MSSVHQPAQIPAGHDATPVWYPERMGSYGNDSGQAVVFRRKKGRWVEVAQLEGADTDTADRFGHAVSASEGAYRLLVGAPGADDEGRQSYWLRCNATGGTFRLIYRGVRTRPVSYNSSLNDFMAIVNGGQAVQERLAGFPSLRLPSHSDPRGSVCGNQTLELTLGNPSTGHLAVGGRWLIADTGDLEGSVTVSPTRTMEVSRPPYIAQVSSLVVITAVPAGFG
jgi:hypothetical protein